LICAASWHSARINIILRDCTRIALKAIALNLLNVPAGSISNEVGQFDKKSSFLRFWSKAGYAPVYLRQTANDLTGEHSCIMIKALNTGSDSSWQDAYFSGKLSKRMTGSLVEWLRRSQLTC